MRELTLVRTTAAPVFFDQVEAGGKTAHRDMLTRKQNPILMQVFRKGNASPLRDAFEIIVAYRTDPLTLQRAIHRFTSMRGTRSRQHGSEGRTHYDRDSRSARGRVSDRYGR